MRMRNGFIELTWKEDLAVGPSLLHLDKVPRWKIRLAPLQHWFAIHFLGHREFDLVHQLASEPIPRSGPPAYDVFDGDPPP